MSTPHTTIADYEKSFFQKVRSAEFSISGKVIAADKWLDEVFTCLNGIKARDKQLFFIGNGASSSMASHFATDFMKNAGINAVANDGDALITCFSNDFSYEHAYLEILKRRFREGDGLISISSSGKSKNIVNASNYVRTQHPASPVITFTAFQPGNELRTIGTHNLYLPADTYGLAESGHSYYLHMLLDVYIATISA